MTESYATPPAGMPPASANPGLWDLANRIALAMVPVIAGVLAGSGITGPIIVPPGGLMPPPAPPPPPPPAPSGPMASMDAADLNIRDGKLLPRRFNDEEVG